MFETYVNEILLSLRYYYGTTGSTVFYDEREKEISPSQNKVVLQNTINTLLVQWWNRSSTTTVVLIQSFVTY